MPAAVLTEFGRKYVARNAALSVMPVIDTKNTVPAALWSPEPLRKNIARYPEISPRTAPQM
ncbi:MAG: hypothetical protein DMF56_06825 [Acidobacteria bacterium]|nr:MAG: hypothetical protein DMF56_06825 [Acidobacteriota bacterium]